MEVCRNICWYPSVCCTSPNRLSLDQLALVETLGIGAHAVRRSGLKEGEEPDRGSWADRNRCGAVCFCTGCQGSHRREERVAQSICGEYGVHSHP